MPGEIIPESRATSVGIRTDKVLRLYAQTALFENGRVLLPRSAPWLAEYTRELTAFPGARYDDQVDSTTQALQYLKDHLSRKLVVARYLRRFSPR
jgi:predicted phage terminase large subunit-like protein